MEILDKALTRKDFFKGMLALTVPLSAATGFGPDLAAAESATTPDVSSKQSSFRSVKDYGAAGDGITDDTAAIQSAFQSNAVIFFPAATYLTSKSLNLISLTNVHIQASGAVIKNSTLNTQTIQMSSCQFITVTGGKFIRSAAITASSPSNQACFTISHCTDVIVQNVLIDGSPGMGVNIQNGVGIKILNNIIRNTTRDGIYSHYSVNTIYSGNYLENITDDALSMHDYGINAAKQNIISLGYPQAGNSLIVNNRIRNAVRGIASIGLQALTISNNIIDHVVNNGIIVFNTAKSFEGPNTYVQDVIISNNIVSYACQKNGISLLGSVSRDNSQGGDGKAAITAGSFGADYQFETQNIRLANVSVTGNMVVASGADGYFLNAIDGLSFSNNVARNCNTSPFPPHTGYIMEFWYCTGLNAFNNSVIDTASPSNTVAGFRTWDTSGCIGGWTVAGSAGMRGFVVHPNSTSTPTSLY